MPLVVVPDVGMVKCPACGDPADVFGDHFLCCRQNGLTERHHALRDAFLDVCTKAGIAARPEQGCFGDTRDADLLLVGWSRGRNTAVDFTVVHPLAPSNWPLALEAVSRELKGAEARKVAVAEERCQHAGWAYQAAAFSPWGMPGPSAKGLLQEISRRAVAALGGWEKTRRLLEIQEGVSVTMQRQVARQLGLRYRVLQDLVDPPCC